MSGCRSIARGAAVSLLGSIATLGAAVSLFTHLSHPPTTGSHLLAYPHPSERLALRSVAVLGPPAAPSALYWPPIIREHATAKPYLGIGGRPRQTHRTPRAAAAAGMAAGPGAAGNHLAEAVVAGLAAVAQYGEEGWRRVTGLLQTYCAPTKFAAAFGADALGAYTPCFEATAIANPVHGVTLAFLLWRLLRIKTELHRGPTRALHIRSSVKWLQSLACLTNALVPCVLLGLHCAGRAALAPFEVTGLAIGAATWGLMTVVLDMEHEVCFPRGYWVYRFLWLLSFTTAAVHARFTLLPFRLNLLTVLSGAQLGSLAVLAGLAVLHWPRCCEKAPLVESTQADTKLSLQVSPQASSSWLAQLTWEWVTPLIRNGYRRPLVEDDVWQLDPALGARTAHRQFLGQWQPEVAKPRPSLLGALWRTFGGTFVRGGLWKLLNDAGQFAGPLLLGRLVAFVRGDGPSWHGYAIAAAIFLGQYLGAVGENQYFNDVLATGLKVQGALTTEVYQKSLRLSQKSRAEQTTGKMLNLVSTDVDQLSKVCQQVHILWSSPLRVLISLYFLYQSLGTAALAGVAALCVFIPVQLRLARSLGRCTQQALQQADQRISITNEILAGIRIIKSYVWERAFLRRVAGRREKELQWVRQAALSRAYLNLNINLAPITMAIVSFSLFAVMGGSLTAEVAFTSVALFNVIKLPLFFFPAVIQVVMEALVSHRRIKDFLLLPEPVPQVSTSTDKGLALQFRDASFSWGEGAEDLADVSLAVKQGALLCVVGETGSGKTTLLMAILGELTRTRGAAGVRGRVAFVSQQPWIFKGTIRENILFGRPYDSKRYAQALCACQLMKDLEALPAGDHQEVGEQGAGLSGGQKQRLSLARAVYADADVYLFDDSLSALDARVGRALFNECILGLLQTKTRVLVCNQLHFVPHADQVVVLKSGRIAEQGGPFELLNNSGEFAVMMQKYGGVDAWLGEDMEADPGPDRSRSLEGSPTSPACPQIVAYPNDQYSDDREAAKCEDASGAEVLCQEYQDGQPTLHLPPEDDKEPAEPQPSRSTLQRPSGSSKTTPAGRFIVDEARASGTTLTRKNVMTYVTALGGPAVLLQASLVYTLLEICRLGNVYWLSWWSQSRWDLTIAQWLGVYALWGIGQCLCSLINLRFLADRGIAAARRTHDTMLNRIVNAPVLFFDSTPLGRIMNRFSKDQRTVDTIILPTLGLCLAASFNLISTTILIGFNTPQTFIIMVPISFVFLRTQAQFRRAAREIRRMENTSRSPIFAHFGETLSGVPTIRAFHAERHMEDANIGYTVDHQRFEWASFVLNRWLSMRLEFLGGLIVLSTGCFAVLQRRQLGAPLLGLTLSQTFAVTALLSFLNRLLADLETAFTSVERVVEYAGVAQERLSGPVSPPTDWPQQGCITFQDVEMRYRPDVPPSLKEVSFQIKPAEKVGVVGRTGAGKSTLLVALYRLSELTAGRIYIDGVDISTVPLERLRSAISIIPQTPILFTGSIRDNLDPFDERTDDEIWTALGQANLKEVVQDLPQQLQYQVTEGGGAFSVGQRQLLCLARALLRRSRILMIDEATANIDTLTDNLIQETIRTQFQECTVITIAHRLNTIIDSDRVLVLNYGWLVQFDTPAKLLSIPYPQPSIFRDLVDETGDASASFLRAVAMAHTRSPPPTRLLSGASVSLSSLGEVDMPTDNPEAPASAPVPMEDAAEEDPLPPVASHILDLWLAPLSPHLNQDPSAELPSPPPGLPALALTPEQRSHFAHVARRLAAGEQAPWPGGRGRLAFILFATQISPKLELPSDLVGTLRRKGLAAAQDLVKSGVARSLSTAEQALIYLAYHCSEDLAERSLCIQLLRELESELRRSRPEADPARQWVARLLTSLQDEEVPSLEGTGGPVPPENIPADALPKLS